MPGVARTTVFLRAPAPKAAGLRPASKVNPVNPARQVAQGPVAVVRRQVLAVSRVVRAAARLAHPEREDLPEVEQAGPPAPQVIQVAPADRVGLPAAVPNPAHRVATAVPAAAP